MYKILSDKNQVLGYVDKPNYIKIKNGDYVPSTPLEAIGINFQGTLYNLLGHSDIEGASTAYASMVTDAELLTMLNLSNASVTMARKQAKTLTDDDERLEVSVLYDDWTPGSYEVGDIYNTHSGGTLGNEWEQTWEVHQAYDNAEFSDIVPGNSSWYTFNRPLHGKSPETARPWVKPSHGTTDTYKVGEYMIWTDGDIYTPTRETSYSPEEYAPDWTNWSQQQQGGGDPGDPGTEDGSQENPITAVRGMAYTYGLYYLDPEDSKVYQCKRTGEADGGTVELQYLPHELVGQYFEEATA